MHLVYMRRETARAHCRTTGARASMELFVMRMNTGVYSHIDSDVIEVETLSTFTSRYNLYSIALEFA